MLLSSFVTSPPGPIVLSIISTSSGAKYSDPLDAISSENADAGALANAGVFPANWFTAELWNPTAFVYAR